MDRELLEVITTARADASRRRLVDQGTARAIIRRDGVEPADGPNFSSTLSDELVSYAFAQLVGALDLRGDEDPSNRRLADMIFREVGEALFSVARNAAPDPMNGFYTVIAAAAFHLGGYAARAFSCLPFDTSKLNLSTPERVFSALMRRELLVVRTLAASTMEGQSDPATLAAAASEGAIDYELFLTALLTGAYCRAVSEFCRALFSRSRDRFADATTSLSTLLSVSDDAGAVPMWWTTRLTIELIADLWNYSLNEIIPSDIGGNGQEWRRLRSRYLDNLLRRDHSEVELWPSQLDAVNTILSNDNSEVFVLPTGAGKTRIAEIAILKCIAQQKRVFYVTPLRALSAQVERGLRQVFLGTNIEISHLYSAIGAQAIDLFALGTANVVVLTPEKLQFALRLDPEAVDDVGLIILDEAHMIGLKSMREIRYEILVQKLLTRSDSGNRRIICLSAVLPSGDDLRDFVAWICRGGSEGAITSTWRPTALRFGLIDWQGANARLSFWNPDGSEDFYVPRFIRQSMIPTPAGRTTRPFPRARNELLVASANRYVADGESVLIYTPERRSVEALARAAILAVRSGAVSLPLQLDRAERALRVGADWLGTDHIAVTALRLGIALHHGDLPVAFRQEVEGLFKDGSVKLMISSPTLAQGLNITVGTVLFSSIFRAGSQIPIEEFVNVCGRAGRPFAASEGHVLFAALSPTAREKQRSIRQWRELVSASSTMGLQSGLVQLVAVLLAEMERLGFGSLEELSEYALNLRSAEGEQGKLAQVTVAHVDAVDEAILGLIGDSIATPETLADAMDAALRGSLWERELARMAQTTRERLNLGLTARATHIWEATTTEQRKRFYAAGLSLRSGIALDALLASLQPAYVQLETAVEARDVAATLELAVTIAEGLFQVELFRGDGDLPSNWKDVLRRWLRGVSLGAAGEASPSELHFVQEVCGYTLAWGLEAIRAFKADAAMAEALPSIVTPLFEFGAPTLEAVILLRLGLDSRTAAVAVVDALTPRFDSLGEAVAWLRDLAQLQDQPSIHWPSEAARLAWNDFFGQYASSARHHQASPAVGVTWYGQIPRDGTIVDVLRTGLYGRLKVYSDDADEAIGEIPAMRRARSRPFRSFVHEGSLLNSPTLPF